VYTEFYKLKEKPFNLTPSSKFLFLGDVHKEALAILTYGVVERKGFVLLTGEVGTGKTTMVRALLADIDNTFRYVHLSNPLLSPEDFRDYLGFFILNKKVHFASKTGFLFAFESFLRKCNQNQENFTLIIDEAQKLSFELLEEIRLLSNMETADDKLINIFLVGQPELNERLSDPRCRALLQRISIRHHITPMDLKGTKEYMATRLKKAGSKNKNEIFPGTTVKAVHQYSEGYPRMINILSDNALILGYARGKKKISPEMIKECYENLQLDRPIRREIKTEKTSRTGSRWKKAAVFFLIIAFSALIVGHYGKDIFFKLIPLPLVGEQSIPEPTPKGPINATKKTDESTETVAKEDTKSEASEKVLEEPVLVKRNTDEPHREAAVKDMATQGEVSAREAADEKPDKNQIVLQKKSMEQESPADEKDKEPWKTANARDGDTLELMAIRIYGRADANIYQLIQKHNPEITDINKISVGQKIVFPPLSEKEHGPAYTVHVASFKPVENAVDMFQKLTKEGYEVFIMPVQDTQMGKSFRVTLGNFESLREAEDYAAGILKEGLFDQAKPIKVDMR
jgi:type II secretory pathway predicted ATPase ExeA/phage tail protein X